MARARPSASSASPAELADQLSDEVEVEGERERHIGLRRARLGHAGLRRQVEADDQRLAGTEHDALGAEERLFAALEDQAEQRTVDHPLERGRCPATDEGEAGDPGLERGFRRVAGVGEAPGAGKQVAVGHPFLHGFRRLPPIAGRRRTHGMLHGFGGSGR
jgi:hypothetical protein